MRKRLLYLEDLYDFYSNKYKRSTKFSAEKTGHQIFVQVPAEFEVNEDVDDSLLFCKVKLMHSGENRNHSSVTDDALTKAAKTLAYKPILANFMEYTDEKTGETLKDFTSHDMELNDDGTINYIEKQVGCFTSDEPFFEVEEETGHNFLYGYCAIPVDYTDAASIIERKNGTKISVELAVNEMAYSAKDHVLELTDVVIMGATLLGKDPETKEDIGEGMLNARLDIADFSDKNNSLFLDYDSTLIEMQDRLSKLESACFNINNNSGKEEVEVENKENFDEVTETEEVTTTEETTEEEVAATENESEETVDETSEETETESTDDVTEEKDYSVTVKYADKEFAVSLQEKIYAIQDLVNATYSEQDNTYYGVSVYDNYVVMQDYWNGKYFKQTYTDENDVYSLTGDRVEVYAEFVTADEQKELESMRSNYSSVVEKLNKYEADEARADKMTVFEDEAYADYLETDEFKALMSADTVDKYTKDQLIEKADATLGKIVKKNKTFSFAAKPHKVGVSIKETTDAPYGNLFSEN